MTFGDFVGMVKIKNCYCAKILALLLLVLNSVKLTFCALIQYLLLHLVVAVEGKLEVQVQGGVAG